MRVMGQLYGNFPIYVLCLLSNRQSHYLFTIHLNLSEIAHPHDGPRFAKRPSNKSYNRAKDTIMTNLLSRFVKDESGATAIEYGLIAALIALAIVAGAGFLGNTINAKFNTIAGTLKKAGSGNGG